jgi:hypothetical protein
MNNDMLGDLEDHEAQLLLKKLLEIIDISTLMAQQGDAGAHKIYALARDCKDLMMFDAVSRKTMQQLTHDLVARVEVDGIEIPPAALNWIKKGMKISAIKEVRTHTGCGLKEAKDAVEKYMCNNNLP